MSRKLSRSSRARGIELIVLAGYMRIITSVLVEPFYGRMINVHPSLLPAFPGVNGIKQAIDYGVKVQALPFIMWTGAWTAGRLSRSERLRLLDGDTEATLAPRIHAAEQELLPWVVQRIAAGAVELEGRYVRIK